MTQLKKIIFSLATLGFAATAAAKALDAQSITFNPGDPSQYDFSAISTETVKSESLLNDEARAILAQPELKTQIKDAVAAAQKVWDAKAERYNFPARNMTFKGLMEWSTTKVNQGNTGLEVELRIPADFNKSGQPTLETVLSGYGDDFEDTGTLNVNKPKTEKTGYSD